MNKNNIYRTLKRYDFANKMKISQLHSSKLLLPNGDLNTVKLKTEWLPWEIDTFAVQSILSINEYQFKNFKINSYDKNFMRIMKEIRNSQFGSSATHIKRDFLEEFLLVIGLTQFPLQEDSILKYYRYRYIFNFKNELISMKSKLYKKFGLDYDHFIKFSVITSFIYSNHFLNLNTYSKEPFLFLSADILSHLTIDRNNFISHQNDYSNESNLDVTSYNLLYKFPFIKHIEKVYLPLPHTVREAVTTSLLARLTEGDNSLRALVGKEIMESYLLHIMNINARFDEIKQEYKYTFKRNEKRTVDLMLRKKNQYILIDSKLMMPKQTLRNRENEDIIYTINRLRDSVKQVYLHATQRFNIEYKPFKLNETETRENIDKDNIFGIVVIFNDSFIRRNLIYSAVCKQLDIEINSKEYDYLLSHIKVLSLYEFEKMALGGYDLFELFKSHISNNSTWNDFTLIQDSNILADESVDHLKDITTFIEKCLLEFINDFESGSN
ncbi:hypothetical protein QK289_04400 [Exiguobacterium antarcticum]|uniref:Restriction endonuclease n=1 Tax=Exiguobacterium antarcticum TaxID=132920 RepID=A0ABT6R1T2_9BACL|nr:hypothetical protein [Exiguobacterium antarcticum]MDI3234239.1 hypothetical protein [Exiguobacterium antarcticum]